MKMRTLAAVAAVFGAAACHGADIGKYMLPDADAMMVSVGDSTKQGAFSKELNSALEGLKPESLLKGSVEKDIAKNPDVEEYILMLTGGVTRVESAFSVKAAPGPDGEPAIDLSVAVAGLKNVDKLFAKLAKDFPQDLKLENGVLAPSAQDKIPLKAWTEDGVLRVLFGKSSGKAAAASPFAPGSAFGDLLAKASGNSYAGLRIKDLVGVVKRFVPAAQFEEMSKDEDVSSFLKLRDAGFDISESETEPVMEIAVSLKFDSAETATDVAEKVAGFKQLGLSSIRESAADLAIDKDVSAMLTKTLKGVKIAANGSDLSVKASIDARDLASAAKKLAESK